MGEGEWGGGRDGGSGAFVIPTLCFAENHFISHLGVHVCVIHTVHCNWTINVCRILTRTRGTMSIAWVSEI